MASWSGSGSKTVLSIASGHLPSMRFEPVHLHDELTRCGVRQTDELGLAITTCLRSHGPASGFFSLNRFGTLMETTQLEGRPE